MRLDLVQKCALMLIGAGCMALMFLLGAIFEERRGRERLRELEEECAGTVDTSEQQKPIPAPPRYAGVQKR